MCPMTHISVWDWESVTLNVRFFNHVCFWHMTKVNEKSKWFFLPREEHMKTIVENMMTKYIKEK